MGNPHTPLLSVSVLVVDTPVEGLVLQGLSFSFT